MVVQRQSLSYLPANTARGSPRKQDVTLPEMKPLVSAMLEESFAPASLECP